MYNTILVPLDGSKRAEAILPHVENMALNYKAKVIFMKVIVPPFTAAPTKKSVERQQKDLEFQENRAGEYLADMQREFQGKGIESSTHLAYGPVVEEVIARQPRSGWFVTSVLRQCYGSPAPADRQAVVANPIQEDLSQVVTNLARRIRFSIPNNPAS